MSKIGFLTDSCSDIPQEFADKYGIEVVGFPINLDGVEYMERKDFTNDQFYQMMRDAQGVPTTAAITQLQWCEIYERYVDEGYTDLVHLCINSAGSSTYNNAVKGAEMLAEERPGHKLNIQLIDSHTYSMPYGWYLCECARKVRNGGELATCVEEMKQSLDRVEICLAAYSLKQMKKSGRVSAAAAVVGDLLGIRPIISLNAGVSKVEAKVRGDAAVPAACQGLQKGIRPCAGHCVPAGRRCQRQHRPRRHCHRLPRPSPPSGGLCPAAAVKKDLHFFKGCCIL